MRTFHLDVVATRGGAVESRHRVHAAVVGDDRLVGVAGDPSLVTFWRSCAKPFQVMPLVASGGFDRAGWGDDQLAVACGSHGGEPEHVAIVHAMLRDLDLEEGDLACGPHDPLAPRGARLLRESGIRATRLHNNCSGKHAAMLARARTEGWSTEGYERDEHPVQRACTEEVARWTGVAPSSLLRAVDGCGVVVYGMSLEAMARAYSRLAGAVLRGDDVPSRVAHAMRTRPFLVGGTDRFDTVLMEETDGGVVAKIGAEGVHSVALLDRGIGVALKVEDGSPRAQFPAVLRLLQCLGALPHALPPRLAEFFDRPVRNTRGEIVGDVTLAS
ncbi:L-asparaginase II [Gemmatirosa kalamazoonensis]|uniref:L-asparaginase II n=1 Tax=Gemmatirosa kalamazoonensis TaxID=861299 RepID=W0RJQ4_9BACT|nr:asparaginase [Gemmatirosa kalamazoonensis]AHG91011.1 L-asparaginase II [Gemmatirosa kalamazoonensis]